MDRRNVLSLAAITALGLALLSDNALAQQTAHSGWAGLASNRFSRVGALDGARATQAVHFWATSPLIVTVQQFSNLPLAIQTPF